MWKCFVNQNIFVHTMLKRIHLTVGCVTLRPLKFPPVKSLFSIRFLVEKNNYFFQKFELTRRLCHLKFLFYILF